MSALQKAGYPAVDNRTQFEELLDVIGLANRSGHHQAARWISRQIIDSAGDERTGDA